MQRWIVLLPLLGFVLNGLLATRFTSAGAGRALVTLIGCSLPGAAFVLTVLATLQLQAAGWAPQIEVAYRWAVVGEHVFEVAFVLDRLSAVMALIVTGIGTLIHVYSAGYMAHDKSYGRFFAYLNLFLFFMLLLVLGRSLLVLFVGWEGVGLASYLLIGFWFDDDANARAGKKAFVTNRIGDAAFLLGMFLLFYACGTLDIDRINAAYASATPPATVPVVMVAVLLFIGASGKSAQLPLHVWLPDAMAGPTPVSALIHAATMVTAGIYLVARLAPVYSAAPEAMALVATVGVATAFFAATIALVQTDIKKVLAYSTVSQLGLMFLALGVGAWGVAIFHVMTHAFFKACLFLGAGSVIHALGGEQDLRRMGGLARRIPITFATFAIATAAIAGIPPLAGFWSKDEILWFALASSRGGSPWLWLFAAATALMTAFYMFRLLWLAFFGTSRMAPEVEAHVHESPRSMTGVLLVLALLSTVGGFVALPHLLEPQWPLPPLQPGRTALQVPVIVASIVIAFVGLALARWVYGSGPQRADRLAARWPLAHRWLSAKYFIDELYDALLARPLQWLSDRVLLRAGDRWLIDGTLHFAAGSARWAAGALASVQSGRLPRYAVLTLAGLALALWWSWRHG